MSHEMNDLDVMLNSALQANTIADLDEYFTQLLQWLGNRIQLTWNDIGKMSQYTQSRIQTIDRLPDLTSNPNRIYDLFVSLALSFARFWLFAPETQTLI